MTSFLNAGEDSCLQRTDAMAETAMFWSLTGRER